LSEQEKQEGGSQKELVYVQPVDYPYSPDVDEIDLADLVGVLVRRKWLIIAGTLLFMAAAIGAAFLMPAKYEATSLFEIGQLYTEENGYRKIEASGAVKNRIHSLGQAVGWELIQEKKDQGNPDEILGFSLKEDFSVEIAEEENVVTATVEAPSDSKALIFLNRVEHRLIKNHNRIFSQEKMQIQTSIKRLEIQNQNIDIQIQELKTRVSEIKRDYAAKIGEKKNQIKQLTNKIDDLNARKSYLKGRIQLLEEEKKELQSRIDKVEKSYNQFLNYKMDANTQASESAAIGLMLFNSELQQMRKYRDQLRQRLLFGIPGQISDLDTDLKELQSSLQNRKAELSLEKKLLEHLEPEMKDKIAKVEWQIQEKKNQQAENRQEIKSLKSKIDNMISTRVVLEPVYSEDPVSPNTKLLGALGLVLGLFVFVFGAFLMEFWESNREKILQKRE